MNADLENARIRRAIQRDERRAADRAALVHAAVGALLMACLFLLAESFR